ncbi:MAG: hypothetical protein WCJ35_01710 [Planctomycetota bacterium]
MPINRSATMDEVENRWFTPCSDNVIYAYRTNELTHEGGNVQVDREQARLKKAGKLPGEGWRAVILPDVDSSGKPIPGLYNNERACFIREDPNGETIAVPRGIPDALQGKFLIVPFYKCGGISNNTATPDGLVDCAHFVSSCLTKGGVSVNQPGVQGLVDMLRHRQDTRTLGIKVTRAQGERILNTSIMDRGDVITFFHDGGYQHSVIYTGRDGGGKHRIACHTIARFDQFFWNDPWHITNQPDWRFTLIHFDEPFTAATGNPQRCEVRLGGASEVYYFLSNGIAKRARGSKSSHQTPGISPHDSGYWFNQAFDAFVVWTMTGQVVKIPVRMDLRADSVLATSIPIDIDGIPGEMSPF